MKRRVWMGITALSLLFLFACPRGGVTWIAGGETEADLTFGISSTRDGTTGVQFGAFRVERCEGPSASWPRDTLGLAWLLVGTLPGQHDYPSRLRYGYAPPGFTSMIGPKPLEAGCYFASSGIGGRVSLTVDSVGRIREE